MTRFYADVHRKKDETGYRITYTTDGETFKHVDSPTKMPVGPGDQVFVDTIPIIHTDGFIELLRRGAEVYYLRRLTLMEKMRQRLGITSKSARADIKALMAINQKWFRKVDENFLLMRRSFSAFRALLDTGERLDNQYQSVSKVEKPHLRRPKNSTEREKKLLAMKIDREAVRRCPVFEKIAEELGIADKKYALAQAALAELLTYVDFTKAFTRIARYLGLCYTWNKKYNHCLRDAAERLTMAIFGKPTKRNMTTILKKIQKTYLRGTRRLAGVPAQQQG